MYVIFLTLIQARSAEYSFTQIGAYKENHHFHFQKEISGYAIFSMYKTSATHKEFWFLLVIYRHTCKSIFMVWHILVFVFLSSVVPLNQSHSMFSKS